MKLISLLIILALATVATAGPFVGVQTNTDQEAGTALGFHYQRFGAGLLVNTGEARYAGFVYGFVATHPDSAGARPYIRLEYDDLRRFGVYAGAYLARISGIDLATEAGVGDAAPVARVWLVYGF